MSNLWICIDVIFFVWLSCLKWFKKSLKLKKFHFLVDMLFPKKRQSGRETKFSYFQWAKYLLYPEETYFISVFFPQAMWLSSFCVSHIEWYGRRRIGCKDERDIWIDCQGLNDQQQLSFTAKKKDEELS